MAPPRRLLITGAALTTAAWMGWGTAAFFPPQTAALGSRSVVDQQVQGLLARQQQAPLSPDERLQLVERLIAIHRFDQALDVLASWRRDAPMTVELTLLIADLRRRSGDLTGAEGDLDFILRLHPDHLETLQLKALVQQQSGRGTAAIQDVEQRIARAPTETRLALGLLLADLNRLNGGRNQARSIYLQLATTFADRADPVLALALMEREDGNTERMQELLAEAGRRGKDPGVRPLIDQLAGRWTLEAARVKAVPRDLADTPQEQHQSRLPEGLRRSSLPTDGSD